MYNKISENKMVKRFYIAPVLVLFLVMILLSQIVNAQVIGRVGSTAAPFLKIGVGGRALGMGEAYTTLAEDITGIYWNPAGLANITKMQVILNHYEYIADLNYDFGALAIPVRGVGTIGAFIGFLGMPDIERTTIQFPNGTGEKVSANSSPAGPLTMRPGPSGSLDCEFSTISCKITLAARGSIRKVRMMLG